MHDIHRPSTLELDDPLVARLYQQHALFIMTYVRHHVPSREEAEDVLLDIFLAALEHPELERFSEQKQLAWLQRVAYHKCVDYHRRASVRQLMPLETVAEALSLSSEAGYCSIPVTRSFGNGSLPADSIYPLIVTSPMPESVEITS